MAFILCSRPYFVTTEVTVSIISLLFMFLFRIVLERKALARIEWTLEIGVYARL